MTSRRKMAVGMARVAALCVASAIALVPLHAQNIASPRDGAPASWPVALQRYAPSVPNDHEVLANRSPHAVLNAPLGGPAPWWAPAASAILPGSGQFALRQQRSVAYLVAEAFLIVQYVAAQRDGNRERAAYRDLATTVARKPFGGTQRASWEYYERLEQFLESGAYDRIPGGPLDPETDATTYNGFRWQLARETFWLNPNVAPAVGSAEYQRALEFYQRSAVGDAFRWSWRDAQLEQNVYIETIRSANRSYQRAVNMLGIVAANHLASLVDAYVSVRVRRYGGVRVAGYAMDGLEMGYAPGANGATLQTGLRWVRQDRSAAPE
jgi:hypothetical protein